MATLIDRHTYESVEKRGIFCDIHTTIKMITGVVEGRAYPSGGFQDHVCVCPICGKIYCVMEGYYSVSDGKRSLALPRQKRCIEKHDYLSTNEPCRFLARDNDGVLVFACPETDRHGNLPCDESELPLE